MTHPEPSLFLRNPIQLEDKLGRPFSIRRCLSGEEDRAAILAMYQGFEPKESCQGLPPQADRRREDWLAGLLRDRLNVMALLDLAVVGHAVILDMEPARCEYLVFVHQDHQDRGIGTALTQAVKWMAAELGYSRIWLTVEAKNDKAIHVYRKFGFRFVGTMDSELEMEASLSGEEIRWLQHRRTSF